MVVHHALNQSAAVDTFWYTVHRAIPSRMYGSSFIVFDYISDFRRMDVVRDSFC